MVRERNFLLSNHLGTNDPDMVIIFYLSWKQRKMVMPFTIQVVKCIPSSDFLQGICSVQFFLLV